MNKKKVTEWVYRIFCFTILESLITIVGFVSLHYGITILEEAGKMTWGVQAGFIQASLAICFLQIANIMYWVMDKNLFNFKELFAKVGVLK